MLTSSRASRRPSTLMRLAVLLVTCAAILCLPQQAFAAYTQRDAGAWKSGTHRVVVENPPKSSMGEGINTICVYDPAYSDKLSGVKTSDKTIVRILHKDTNTAVFELRKPGKATITYKFNGKTYTHKLVVRKYANPVKTFKIGTKNYATKFKKYSSAQITAKLAGKKVKVTPAAGWKLKYILVANDKGEKHVKNGYTFKKGDEMVDAILKNTKTGVEQAVLIYRSGPGAAGASDPV